MKRKGTIEGFDSPTDYWSEYIPTGILCFRMKEKAYHTTEWKEGKLPLEKQLSKIMAGIEIRVKKIKEEWREIHEYWEEQRRKKQIETDIKERKEKELMDFKELIKGMHRWHHAETLRNYINEIENQAIIKNSLSQELVQWIDWARKKANWYDPLLLKQRMSY